MRVALASVAALAFFVPAPIHATHGVNDPYYPQQWAVRRTGAHAAWHTTTGAGVTIAIVDTGVNHAHPDLARNMHPAQYDFLDDDADPWDVQGHGTLVAGLAAAVTNNGQGIAGMAPSARIMAARVGGRDASDGSVSSGAVADAVIWAADQGADVINLSLSGGLVASGPMDVAATYAFSAGAVVVAAAGNDDSPLCGSPAFNPVVLCVGATDELDHRAGFSNYGGGIDITAPGTNTVSTTNYGGYAAASGTSMSAPIVAGAAAQLVAMGANNILAMHLLKATAKDLGTPGYDLTYGWGRLDVAAAVALCRQVCVP